MHRGRVIVSLHLSAALIASALVLTATPAGAQPIETVVVSSKASAGQSSTTVLNAGTTYVFEASGTISYGFQNGLSDVECSTLPPDPTWQPFRYFFLDPESDFLDVLVNGDNVMWQPVNGDAFGCNSSNHRYRLTFTPEVSGTVNFRVLDSGYSDNQGSFVIDIHEATETLVQSLVVPTNARFGVNSVSLNASNFYRIVASGTGTYDNTGNQLDAECTTFAPDPTWQPNRFLLLDLEEDIADLYVAGQNVAWQAQTADLFGCDSTDHVYDVIFRPAASGPVNFGIRDTNYRDNGGALNVSIFQLAFVPTEGDEVLSPPGIVLAEQLEVNSADSDGTTSTAPFAAGQQILIEVIGSYTYGFGAADARCSTISPSTTFVPSEDNFPSPAGVLQLVVNQQIVPWNPTSPDGGEPECNSTDHQYRLIYVPSESGQLNFRVRDTGYRDNGGVLTVRIFRIQEIPAGMVFVDSTNPAGAMTPPLIAGRTYRLRASGTYGYFQAVPGTSADAECAQADFPPVNQPLFQRNTFGSGNNDLLDIFVNNANVEWLTAAEGSDVLCDADHLFDLTLTPSANGPINLRIKDTNHMDNSGVLQVQLFLKAS